MQHWDSERRDRETQRCSKCITACNCQVSWMYHWFLDNDTYQTTHKCRFFLTRFCSDSGPEGIHSVKNGCQYLCSFICLLWSQHLSSCCLYSGVSDIWWGNSMEVPRGRAQKGDGYSGRANGPNHLCLPDKPVCGLAAQRWHSLCKFQCLTLIFCCSVWWDRTCFRDTL